MKHRPRTTTDNQRAQMRSCIYSACETARDLTPIYLCNKPRKGQPVCMFHDRLLAQVDEIETCCRQYEVFPERFDN